MTRGIRESHFFVQSENSGRIKHRATRPISCNLLAILTMTEKEFKLAANSELRFALANYQRSISITLVKGSAELFGSELVEEREYKFCGQKGAIFTWYGCTLKVAGAIAREVYVSTDTPMKDYVNVHGQIESAREDAVAFSADGPRVLVVGSTDSGKSSLCRLLLNYAVRMELEKMADCINKRLEINTNERAAGLIVNTCGWVNGEGYNLILHACKTLACDVVLVIGHDRLFNSLQADVSGIEGLDQTAVLKVPRSGGVVERSAAMRKANRMQRIRQYFYGNAAHKEGNLQPTTKHISFDDVKIFEIGKALRLAKEMTPETSVDVCFIFFSI
eukprot:GSMAST32.ASY1.ANO1.2698.1 assembled CDS